MQKFKMFSILPFKSTSKLEFSSSLKITLKMVILTYSITFYILVLTHKHICMGVCIKCFTINVLLRTFENDKRTKILPLVHFNFLLHWFFINNQMDIVYPNTFSGWGSGKGRDRTASSLQKPYISNQTYNHRNLHTPLVQDKLSSKTPQ